MSVSKRDQRFLKFLLLWLGHTRIVSQPEGDWLAIAYEAGFQDGKKYERKRKL